MTIKELLQITCNHGASDLHCSVGAIPQMRVSGHLVPIPGATVAEGYDVGAWLAELTTEAQAANFSSTKDIGFLYAIPGVGRFRVAIFHASEHPRIAIRVIPPTIPTMDEIGLPPVVKSFTELPNGLVLVTGPNGSGKSTTLAAMINHIAQERAEHIVTLEDPMEFLIPHGQSVVHQRELGSDFASFQESLKHLVRLNANVVMVGEMRDLETIAATITLAETGHLVFATLHTMNAPQTISRIIDVFPPGQQAQIRSQRAVSLRGVISQSLIPAVNGGRVAVREVLVNTPATATMIRDNKPEQLHSVMQTSGHDGMITREQSLKNLRVSGLIEGGML